MGGKFLLNIRNGSTESFNILLLANMNVYFVTLVNITLRLPFGESAVLPAQTVFCSL